MPASVQTSPWGPWGLLFFEASAFSFASGTSLANPNFRVTIAGTRSPCAFAALTDGEDRHSLAPRPSDVYRSEVLSNRALVWWLWVLALYFLCLYVGFRWTGADGGGGGTTGLHPGSD